MLMGHCAETSISIKELTTDWKLMVWKCRQAQLLKLSHTRWLLSMIIIKTIISIIPVNGR